MVKITFIGAGSYGFTLKLLVDILSFEALRDCEFAFMDIRQERLDHMKMIIQEYFREKNLNTNVLYTLDIEKALEGADFVFNLVRVGFKELSEVDLDIPKKYGLYQSIGDTSGVGGVFRGLRTMIQTIELCKYVEKTSAKGARILNYTNPQAMLVMAAANTSKVPFTGLCHSVQGTTKQIANYLEIPYEKMNYEAAGINHMNWITKLEMNGNDLYPGFREKVKKQGIFGGTESGEEDIFAKLGATRLDIMNRVGYMVSESSDHFPEYVPFYLRDKELIKKYGIQIDREKKGFLKREKKHSELIEGVRNKKLPEMEVSVEYGPVMINSMVTDQPSTVYANVINNGLITNLPQACTVEVLSVVDRNGVHPCYYGELPTQLAAMCSMQIYVHKLAVQAILNRDRKYVYWALMMDPATHSILNIDQIEQLVDELIENEKDYLKGYLC